MINPTGRPRSSMAWALLLGGLWLLGAAVSEAAAQDDVPFSFALRKSTVILHEPVFVELAVENRLTEKIHFNLGLSRKANFQFTVTEPGGTAVSPPRTEEGGLVRSGQISVEPGATLMQNVLVDEWYDFSKPGTYRMQVKLVDLGLRTESGTLLSNQVLSSPMALQIDPADPGRLSQVCQVLAESARASQDYAKRGEDALALSYIVDPVAIPHLVKLAKTPSLEKLGVLGLARIARVEGIEQVISELGTGDPELEQSIRGALECIKQGCHAAD